MPRARPRARRGLARLAPSRSRPQRDPGRAERQARPAGTGSPGRAEPALRDVFPGGGSGFSRRDPLNRAAAHRERSGNPRPAEGVSRGRAPTRVGAPLCYPGLSCGRLVPRRCSRCGNRARAFPPCPHPRFGGAGSGPLRRNASGDLPAGEAEGAGRCSGPAEPLGERDRAGASGAGVREPGEGAAPVPAGGCQPRDAAPGLSQAGWAGVTGLLMVILFISLAASPELCLQRGLVVPAAPALCLDRGLL